jgi:hypothetical protein
VPERRPGAEAGAIPLLVLVHSPALGPESWQAVAAILTGTHAVAVPSLIPALHQGAPFWAHQAELVRRSLPTGSAVLIGHSGAGPLLPLIGATLDHPVLGYVFVDAGLPRLGGSWMAAAPPAFAEQLRSMAAHGWLPPWSDWWDDDDLASELPDDTQRAAFRAGLQSLPLAMFEEPRPAAEVDAPAAYLLLSRAYSQEADAARRRGWPVIEENSSHLALLTDPSMVAHRIIELLDRLESVSGRPAEPAG